jgi:hypothetical protein
MPERDGPDLAHVRAAMREHDERHEESEPAQPEPAEEREDDGAEADDD